MVKKKKILKKRFVTKKSASVTKLAKNLVKTLKPYCKRIKIVGSIRRKEKNPGDIDIVLIPKDKENLEEFMKKKGKYVQRGEKESTFKMVIKAF